MPKVSIVVPIYNVEKYLDRSIQSLIKQSLQDIEIILVNDGSKDNSLSICKKYQNIDQRIKVIDKSNGGVSSARNEGIKTATGEYIGFIDPDDWVEPNMYEQLYIEIVNNKCEIAMCNFVIDDSATTKEIKISTEKQQFNRQDIDEWLIPNMLGPEDLNSNGGTIMGSVWRLLVKRELILEKHIYFPLNIPLMEDLLWCIEIFSNTNSVILDKGLYYHYMKNDNSAVRGYRANLDDLNLEVFNKIESLLSQYNIQKKCEYRMNLRYVNMIIGNIKNEVYRDNLKSKKEKRKNIKILCRDVRLKMILKEIDVKKYTFRKRMTLWALKKGLVNYMYVYYSVLGELAAKKFI